MKSIFFIIIILTFSLFLSCEDTTQKKISEISVHTQVVRFDSLFFESDENRFKQLFQDFPFFFPKPFADTIWYNKRKDTLEQEVYAEVKQTFGDFSTQEKQLTSVFQHIKYYFPKFQAPKVITTTTNVDYTSRMIYTDTLLIIGLDNYLGSEHRFYQGFSEYIRQELQPQNIPIDVALSISDFIIANKRNTTFLEAMINQGKQLYLCQKFLPQTKESDILKYTNEKYQWAKANEAEIWRYFIQNQLLYNTDKNTLNRFISLAPFSKFYLELDHESPGGIGRFIGWQIVQSFMKKHPDDLEKLLKTSYQDLFEQAKYKPNR